MIADFGVENFYSFLERAEFSFKLGSNCPSSISNGEPLSKVLCFKGANGSGKTNALKILPLFVNLCCNSFKLKPDDKILVEPFFKNDLPTKFFINFIINEIEYRYEVVLNKDKIFSEKIYRTINRVTLIISRENNELKTCINEFSELKIIKLRSNASLISTAHQYEIKSLDLIYNFLKSIISNVGYFGFRDDIFDVYKATEFYNDDKELFHFIKKIIKECDLGIQNIKIKSRIDEEKNKIYFPVFYHNTRNGLKVLTYHSQSSGTKALYIDLLLYYYVLKWGSILVLDEFDIYFHPHILPKLLELFTNSKVNKKNSQLIFTTHNLKIIDKMSKYRTYAVNKDENESYCYRLDEIPGDILRNDRLISRIYDSGKIGGVPRI